MAWGYETNIKGPPGPSGGPPGPAGADGPPGPTGPAGADSTVPGPQGPQGPQGIKGDTGNTGNTGSTGSQGPAGPANSLAIGTVTTVAPGGAATSTITGTPPSQTLNLGIPTGATGAASTVPGPQGPQGNVGPAGPAGPAGGAVLNISDPPPATPEVGRLWFESDTGNTYIWYDDGNSQQWVQINVGATGSIGPQGVKGDTGATGSQGPQGIPGLGATAQTRNRIVNPAMQISQEWGTTAGTTNNYYPVDQWYLNFSATTAVVSVSQALAPAASAIPYRFRAAVTTADTSMTGAKFCNLGTKIEGKRVADFAWPNGSPVVLQFQFNGPAGTYTAGIRSGAIDAAWLGTFTISAGEAGTFVSRSFAIPAPTLGTWATDSTVGLYFHVCLAAGTTTIIGVPGWQGGNVVAVSGQTNGLASTSNNFYLSNVGLYLDPLATGVAPAWQMPDEAEELRACMRYYQAGLYGQFSGSVTSGQTYYAMAEFLAPMRAAATFTAVNVGTGSGFPTTPGTVAQLGYSVREGRACNLTATGGIFSVSINASARM